jgi:hypothetical protein
MPGRRATAAQERQFWALVAGGLNPSRAAVEVGMSRQWGWRKDAAERVVEALQDRSRRSYIVANEPPGSGKSTLFTHDIPVWLIAGGGLCDPLRGRAVRVMLGSFGYRSAIHYVQRIQRALESPRPFYEKASQRRAELSLVGAFGRFRPRQQGISWKADEFIVEQLDAIDLAEKGLLVDPRGFEPLTSWLPGRSRPVCA